MAVFLKAVDLVLDDTTSPARVRPATRHRRATAHCSPSEKRGSKPGGSFHLAVEMIGYKAAA